LNIYEKSGYLNVPAIANLSNINFYVLLGARRIGKTYGTLKYLLEQKEPFIFIRRTMTELEAMAANGELNPFFPIDPEVYFERADKYTFYICRGLEEEKQTIGLASALTTFSKMRGFNGDKFKYIIYDEFIPERHVQKIKAEGDALLNLYVTVNSNRELEGLPAVKMFLLANSNNLANDVLASLGITDKIDRMIKQGQEYSILPDSGLFILMSNSSPIAERRSKTAIYKLLDKDSEFYKMSINNEFAYNDRHDVRQKDYRHYTPIIKYVHDEKTVFIVGRSVQGDYYLYNMPIKCRAEIADNETGRKLFATTYRNLYWAYISDSVSFQTFSIKTRFLDIFENSR